MSLRRVLAVPLIAGVVAFSVALGGYLDAFSGSQETAQVQLTSAQLLAADSVANRLPGDLSSMQRSVQNQAQSITDSVAAVGASLPYGPFAPGAVTPDQAPVSPAPLQQAIESYVASVQETVGHRIEAAIEQGKPPTSAATDPVSPVNTSEFAEVLKAKIQGQANAIQQEAQAAAQAQKADTPVQPQEQSQLQPGCSTEQEALPGGHRTTVRCLQQESRTGNSSGGSVSSVTSSASITTSSSVSAGSNTGVR